MSKHDIIADLKRVASEIGHAPSRDEYHRAGSGRFSERQVKNAFGTYGMASMAAGFGTPKNRKDKETPTLEEKRHVRELQKYNFRELLWKKYEAELQPYCGKYDRTLPNIFTVLAMSDLHSQWAEYLEIFLDVASRMQPDLVVLGGDIFDFYQVSPYSKNPDRRMSLQSEINYVQTHLFEPLRQACPKAQIDFLLGNHEWRLFKFLCENPGLSSLDCLKFDQLFGLADYEINLVARPTFLSATREREKENFKVYRNIWAMTHGTAVSRFPAADELRRWGISGCSGHVHRHTVAHHRDLKGLDTWHTLGAMCQLKSGEEYIQELVTWTQGFLAAHIHGTKVFQEYFDLSSGFACIGGKYYRKKELILPPPAPL